MKKICFITKFVKGVHSYTGGMETHASDLINELKKDKDYEISIVTSRHPKGIKFENRDGINLYYTDETIGRNPLSRYKFFKAVAKKLEKIKYEKKFDLLHIQSDFGMGYFQYIDKKIPVVTTAHGTTIDEFRGSVKAKKYLLPIWLVCLPFYKRSEKNMLKNSDKVICVSDVVKRSLLKNYKVLNKNKMQTIFNGVDLNEFKKIKSKEVDLLRSKFAKQDDFLIISVGNIIKQKGYPLLIDAMPSILRNNKKVKLVIIGDGDYLNKLKYLVHRNHLENFVFFTGRVDRNDLKKYYSMSDCFAFPTLRGEGLPYVLIEAMASGNVVVTTPNGGTDLVNHKNGIVLKKNSVNEIAMATLKLIRDKKYYNSLLRQSVKDVKEKCDLMKMVERNKKIYGEIL